jgi:predicted nucleic acid-binding protein
LATTRALLGPSLCPAGTGPQAANDSWIVSCCVVQDVRLATFNINDYADFPSEGASTVS